MVEPMVSNPQYARLKELLDRTGEAVRQIRQAYLPAVHAMHDGKVWTGPTARDWTADLDRRQRRLLQLAQRAITAVEQELQRHPREVTAAEADQIRRRLAGRL
ncbi:hypothetical protein E1286_40010 [Nonomuraea terrae]|uniref:WXG100 family type VII secretion target n=1 Tax=Nonomuraea terrae TaxID=2530383 RepID=A0A4V2YIJ4_9ACTN|nr:hypothetical protein [Nonomuraea terrae]TDD35117.1 hypothetical protein E1286_40010 [Nonomuraea terrae]